MMVATCSRLLEVLLLKAGSSASRTMPAFANSSRCKEVIGSVVKEAHSYNPGWQVVSPTRYRIELILPAPSRRKVIVWARPLVNLPLQDIVAMNAMNNPTSHSRSAFATIFDIACENPWLLTSLPAKLRSLRAVQGCSPASSGAC